MTHASRTWELLPQAPQSFINEHSDLDPLIINLLYERSLHTQEEIDAFLHPNYSNDVHDPFLFQDMDRAVRRLFTAIEKEEYITIHGDYDADGVSAAVILHDTLTTLGAKHVDVYLPHRETDGYGLNNKTIDYLATEKTTLIITCDCGISNTAEIAYANSKGIDTIITDHHSVPEILPEAHAIIHPKVIGESYPDKELAGGAVAFKLAQGLLHTHHQTHKELPNGESHEGFEKWLLDMVAIATVADMVPLLGESRTLTQYGLVVLNKTRRIGLKKLFQETGLMHDDESMKQDIDAVTIGFRIAPQINAAGRIGNANVAYNLLTAQYGTDAIDLAFTLNQNNTERRELTERYVEQAITDIEANQKGNPILFVYHETWTTGIVGLIASRLKTLYDTPVIAMAPNGNDITGSGRSIKGFNLIEALRAMPEFFEKFGGHPMACGFSLKHKDERKTFEQAFMAYFKEKTKDIDLSLTLSIAANITLADINWERYDLLEKFKPFGQKNPEPIYAAYGVTVSQFKGIGKIANHLKITLTQDGHTKQAIGWNLCLTDKKSVNWCNQLTVGEKIDIAFHIGVNEWNGNRNLQLTIVDIKQS
ncbi:single-stranded-DNA-specific exonuclease RecJ [Patescibacteria group bacterium]|nr:single-stranded-DNA-specific exonuclease RecJ [Patescibacteria group bacterium]MBU1722074.1 single-stranded-DNA-specific exonuclease RecJ [Patescibacteria group bacterium]MBU1901354.1 single-stranded-DNA-specific exonuclease RecJ [Patescibacteria group bacterium]